MEGTPTPWLIADVLRTSGGAQRVSNTWVWAIVLLGVIGVALGGFLFSP